MDVSCDKAPTPMLLRPAFRPALVLDASRGRGLQEEQTIPHATRVQTDTVRYGADTVRYLQRGGACLPAGPHERLVRGVDNQPTVFVLARVIQRNLHLRFS